MSAPLLFKLCPLPCARPASPCLRLPHLPCPALPSALAAVSDLDPVPVSLPNLSLQDLKCENILLGSDGNLRVIDYGLAKVTEPVAPRPVMGREREWHR